MKVWEKMPSHSERPQRPQRPKPPVPRRAARIKPRRPSRDNEQPPNPLEMIEEARPTTGDVEKDLTAEQLEIKEQLKKQDKAQRTQFKNIYDTGYYYVDCFATRADRDRAQALQARVLGVAGDDVTGTYRDGHVLVQAWEQIAQEVGVDVSDL